MVAILRHECGRVVVDIASVFNQDRLKTFYPGHPGQVGASPEMGSYAVGTLRYLHEKLDFELFWPVAVARWQKKGEWYGSTRAEVVALLDFS